MTRRSVAPDRSPTASPAGRTHFTRRARASEEPTAGVPESVPGIVRGGGSPLDPATRGFMERRFGHDFSRIRIHADSAASESAAAAGALAFTAGDHVAFAPGQYRPDTLPGRAALAHELAHTIQQRGAGSHGAAENPDLERVANDAALRVAFGRGVRVAATTGAPPVQYLKVTPGALGKALEVYTQSENVPDQAIRLLQSSPTFMKLAATIDANFVWRGDSYKVDPSPDLGPDGRILKGPFRGRRELFDVLSGPAEFEPFEAPPEPGKIKVSGDVIHLTATSTPEFIQELAHEVTHAARSVGASAPPPATLAAEINAGVTDELEARSAEAKILGEIPSKPVRARAATVGTRVPAEIERDISPAFGMTYLENFFFGGRLREAQKAEGLTDDEAEKVRADVEKDVKAGRKVAFVLQPRPTPGGIFDLSTYADVWMNRRTAQIEWEEFQKQNSPGDPDYAAEKEKLLQDHASRFFEGRAAYQPLPARVTTP